MSGVEGIGDLGAYEFGEKKGGRGGARSENETDAAWEWVPNERCRCKNAGRAQVQHHSSSHVNILSSSSRAATVAAAATPFRYVVLPEFKMCGITEYIYASLKQEQMTA